MSQVRTPPPPGPDDEAQSDTGDEFARLRQEFGRRIKVLRERLGLTQLELAGRAGLHRAYLGRVEGGHQNIALHGICQVAHGLNCDAGLLLSELQRLVPAVGGVDAPTISRTFDELSLVPHVKETFEPEVRTTDGVAMQFFCKPHERDAVRAVAETYRLTISQLIRRAVLAELAARRSDYLGATGITHALIAEVDAAIRRSGPARRTDDG